MKSLLLISIILMRCSGLGAQQIEAERIIGLSKKYYSTKNAGQFSVKYTFKSAIAESYQTDTNSIGFCNLRKIQVIGYGNSITYLDKDNYYLIDNKNKRYIDLSKNKSAKQEKLQFLNQFPPLNPRYFDQFKTANFKIEKIGSFFKVYNIIDQYYFDTATYSIIKHTNLNYSQHGIQIKEWELLNVNYLSDCNLDFFQTGFPTGYSKVKTFREKQQLEISIGVNIKSIIKENYMLDNGTTFTVNTKGKYLLLDFFYQSCMPCILSFKDLKILYPYVQEKKLLILGIDPVLNDSTSMNKFKIRYNLTHPIITGYQAQKLNNLLNPTDVFPSWLLIDDKGFIVEIYEGHHEGLAVNIKKYLDINKK